MLTCHITNKKHTAFANSKGVVHYGAYMFILDGEHITMACQIYGNDLRKVKRRIKRMAKFPMYEGRPVRFIFKPGHN